MNQLRDLITECLPADYTVFVAEGTKDEDVLKADKARYIKFLEDNPKLVYLVHTRRRNEIVPGEVGAYDFISYHCTIFYKGLRAVFPLHITRADLKRFLDEMDDRRAGKEKAICNICDDDSHRVGVCGCRYKICDRCRFMLVHSALVRTRTDKLVCPHCQRKAFGLAFSGNVSYQQLKDRFRAEITSSELKGYILPEHAQNIRAMVDALP